MKIWSTVLMTFVWLLGVTAAPSDNSSSNEGLGGRSYGNNYLTSQQVLANPQPVYTTQAPRGFSKVSGGDDGINYNTGPGDTYGNNNIGYRVVETNNNGYQSTVTSNNGYGETGANYNNGVNNGYGGAGTTYNNGYDSVGANNNGYISKDTNYNNVYGSMRTNNNVYSAASNNNGFGFTNFNSPMNDVQKYNTNSGYTTSVSIQPSLQTQYSLERFHPHTSFKGEEDSHAGEVVLPPVSVGGSQDLLAAGSQLDLQDSFLQSTDSDPVSVPVPEAPSETKPPQLPYGYDYHPPPPPPPPTAPNPYYYPPPPPSNQYLPVPQPPPPPPPPPDQERQADYTYYYLGPKLWYIPLFFSIYFVLYVGALIIKAISKHKILFPQQLYNAASSVNQARGRGTLDQVTTDVFRALNSAAQRYFRSTKARY